MEHNRIAADGDHPARSDFFAPVAAPPPRTGAPSNPPGTGGPPPGTGPHGAAPHRAASGPPGPVCAPGEPGSSTASPVRASPGPVTAPPVTAAPGTAAPGAGPVSPVQRGNPISPGQRTGQLAPAKASPLGPSGPPPPGAQREALEVAVALLRDAAAAQHRAIIMLSNLLPAGPRPASRTIAPAPRRSSPTEELRVPPTAVPMTARERQVFAQLLRGQTNRQIARILGISEQTVKNHLRSVFGKLGVADRLQAVLAITTQPVDWAE